MRQSITRRRPKRSSWGTTKLVRTSLEFIGDHGFPRLQEAKVVPSRCGEPMPLKWLNIGSLTKQRSNCLGALWRARNGNRAMSRAQAHRLLGSGSPSLARGGPPVISPSRGRRFTREHFAQPVERSVACARVGTKRSAAGLFLLVGD